MAADNTRLGITVLCLFGVAWTLVLIPLSSASTPVALTIMAIAVLWAGSLLLASRQRDFTPTEQTSADAAPLNAAQRQRVFVITNVAQAVVFSVVISICIATARVEWIPLFAALFVGLHFIPLAWAFAELSFGWAGAALTILGGLGAPARHGCHDIGGCSDRHGRGVCPDPAGHRDGIAPATRAHWVVNSWHQAREIFWG